MTEVQFRRGGTSGWTMKVQGYGERPVIHDLYETKPDAGGVSVISVVFTANHRKFATGRTAGGRLVAWPLPAEGVTDDELDAWVVNTIDRGHNRSVPFLRPLTPEQRQIALREAHIRMNTSTGWIFSSAVEQAARDVARGEFPMTKLNERLMAHDPTGHKAEAAARQGKSFGQFADEA